MRNLALAQAFEQIAATLEILDESPFKIRAYRRVARTLMELPEDIGTVAREGRLRTLPGVGEAIAAKIAEWLETGRIGYLERLKEQVPEGVLELLEIPGIGPHTARALHAHLGVASLAELEAAARAGRLRSVKGIGARTETAILEGIARWQARSAGRTALPYALATAEEMTATLAGLPGIREVAIAGEVRRAETMVEVIQLVATVDESATAGGAAGAAMGAAEPIAVRLGGTVHEGPWAGTRQVVMTLAAGARVVVWLVAPSRAALALWWATGPEGHVDSVLERLARRGWRWDPAEGGLMAEEAPGARAGAGGSALEVTDETQLYAAAGLPWIPPELRWGEDEVEQAEHGRLPGPLVELSDLQGDLHVHTAASDGTASLEAMAAEAAARGLTYLAITDHSPSLAVARGLTPERLAAQLAAIAQFNAASGPAGDGPGGPAGRAQVYLLSGTEVDIRPDGSLDYPDEVLAGLDMVVASVHTAFRMDEAAMTRRLVAAVRHPHVRVLGHPTGRLLGRRDPYPVDLDAVLRAAAEAETAVEINASPDRLDLDAVWARRARDLGVRIAIDTDAHSPAQLGFLRYGVLVARRAGLTPADVLNTLPVQELSRPRRAFGR